MSRYIDLDEFLENEGEAYMNAQIKLAKENADKTIDATRYINQLVHKKLLMLIADTPSIGIVRCKECKFSARYVDDGHIECRLYSHPLRHDYHEMKPDDFCSYGVKKGADDE